MTAKKQQSKKQLQRHAKASKTLGRWRRVWWPKLDPERRRILIWYTLAPFLAAFGFGVWAAQSLHVDDRPRPTGISFDVDGRSKLSQLAGELELRRLVGE